jgi:hypothetical protein
MRAEKLTNPIFWQIQDRSRSARFLMAFALCRSTSRVHAVGSTKTGHEGDEQIIGQLNVECLNPHDVGDVATLDRIEDSDFTLCGDFGVVSKQAQPDEVRKRTRKPVVPKTCARRRSGRRRPGPPKS